MSTLAPVRAAAVQLNSQESVPENLQVCERLVAEAATKGAELVVLPEAFAYLGPDSGRSTHAERLGDREAPIQGAVARWASRHGLTVVAGGLPETSEDPSRPFNSSVVFDPRGEVLAAYRKVHLFDVDLADGTKLQESDTTAAGAEPVAVQACGIGVGLSICYDVRFPEHYRRLVDLGASVLTVPAAFTLHTGRDHWHVLLRARAIESQCWLVGAGQWGEHPRGRRTYGHSLIVDPWGTVVAQCSDGIGVAVADMPADVVTRVREQLPALRHRRL